MELAEYVTLFELMGAVRYKVECDHCRKIAARISNSLVVLYETPSIENVQTVQTMAHELLSALYDYEAILSERRLTGYIAQEFSSAKLL